MTWMTWRDTLELGLKEDAPYRKDNVPESQIRGPEIPMGRGDENYVQLTVPFEDEQEPHDD